MKIPYAALRFSKRKQRGLNFMRRLNAMFKIYLEPVDTKIGAVIPQAGILEGIEKYKTRLL
jgi:hypothetical protein